MLFIIVAVNLKIYGKRPRVFCWRLNWVLPPPLSTAELRQRQWLSLPSLLVFSSLCSRYMLDLSSLAGGGGGWSQMIRRQKKSKALFLYGLWGENRFLEFSRNKEWNRVGLVPWQVNFLSRNQLFIFSSFPWNRCLHRGIDFSQGIYSVEWMPGVLESLKIRALLIFFSFISIMTLAQEPHIQLPNEMNPCSHTDKHQQSHT